MNKSIIIFIIIITIIIIISIFMIKIFQSSSIINPQRTSPIPQIPIPSLLGARYDIPEERIQDSIYENNLKIEELLINS